MSRLFFFFTPLASYQSVLTKTRRHSSKLGLFPDYRKVGLFKEDGLKLRLFMSINPIFKRKF